MSKHTPTPWKVVTGLYGTTSIWADGEEMAICPINYDGARRPPEESTANAEFIVRAVNCHDELLAALEDILASYDANDSRGIGEAIEESRAAIKTATTPRVETAGAG